MIRKQAVQTRLLLMLVIVLFLLAGCAAKKSIWGDPKSGLILTYRMAENEILKYETSASEVQKLEIMGQTRETINKVSIKFSVQGKGLKEKNLLLGITVKDMKIDTSGGMTGKKSLDMSPVTGKSFDMTLSPIGKEVGFSGTKSLEYEALQESKRNIESSFRNIFPNLAGNPVKIGDTWPTKEEVTEKVGGVEIHVVTESVNTLQGLETLNGMECVKIETKTTGTLDGEGEQMGNQFTFKGKVTGTAAWYFAYKKGVFVKLTANSTTKGSVELTAQGMSLPLTQESKAEINLVK